jgi:hypothetical protein
LVHFFSLLASGAKAPFSRCLNAEAEASAYLQAKSLVRRPFPPPSRQLPFANRFLLTVFCQLLTVFCQLLTVSCQPLTAIPLIEPVHRRRHAVPQNHFHGIRGFFQPFIQQLQFTIS